MAIEFKTFYTVNNFFRSKLEMFILGSVHNEFNFFCISGALGRELTNTTEMNMTGFESGQICFLFQTGK